MDPDDDIAVSKYLSWVLRHDPGAVGLTLDTGGWASVDDVVRTAVAAGRSLTAARVVAVVAASDKQRFALSADASRIRAQQGQSVEVELDHPAALPPALLFHGTAEASLASIGLHGLRKRERHHVHLSPDEDTARRVGARRGRPVVLTVQAGAMSAAGHRFFLTPNGVWLTEHVPPEYVQLPGRATEAAST